MASSYGHRPDVPRRDRNASSRKANNRLPGEDGRESQDLPDSVLSRYQRDAYQGRRSDSGPERFHGHADDDSVFAEPFQVRTERANDRSALYERDQGGYVGEKERRERKRAARRAKKRSKDIYKTPVSGKTRAKRVLWSLLGVLIVILVAMGFWMHALDQNMHIDDPELDDALSGHVIPGRPYYVLIVGSDARGDEASRTDTIILARVDPSENQLTLISIPRDTRVDIPGYGMSKINAAHAYGGAALTVRTVEEFAGVDIAHYFEVGFTGFADVVDAVGGVTVDVPPNTVVDDVALPEGTQTLNGEQALVFVRCRETYALGDFQRAANQRAFMVALADKVLSSPPWRWPGLGLSISKCIGTDAWSWELMFMMLGMNGMDSSSIYTAAVPSSTETIDGVSYVITDEDAWAEMLARVNAGEDPNA